MTNNLSGLVERLEAHMGKADMLEVLEDCRAAAAAITTLTAALEKIANPQHGEWSTNYAEGVKTARGALGKEGG
jgi:hypothetical protein